MPKWLNHYVMHKLEPPDTYCLSAAIGWLELGSPKEARSELAAVSAADREHPDVLEVRWLLAAEEKQWEEGLEVAQLLVQRAPKRASGWLHRAYALRRVPGGSVAKAWEALLPASEMFPKEALIPYNLCCYACQMRQLDSARAWLKRAIAGAGKERIKRMALQDEDLEPLRAEIQAL